MTVFRRRWARILAGAVVGVPAIGGVTTYAYIQNRIRTRPPDHVFQPLVKADGSLILNDFTIEAPSNFQIFKRIFELLCIFVPLFVRYMFAYGEEAEQRYLEHALLAVERAGPAFVKLGQWTTTRRDLFSEKFRKVFSRLYCETSYHSFAESKRVIEDDFKQPIEEVFETLDEGCIGSGSIGQVHKGILRETGQTVVVKVMHPRVIETIALDFIIINSIAKWADRNFKNYEHYNFTALALAWTNHLAAQLDFRIEHEHLDLFNENFADVDYVRFPKGIRSTQRVLIETFEDGKPAAPEYLQSLDEDTRDILASKGLNCFCKMLLHDNFIHGDMHPGNILVDTTDPRKPQAIMIDVGLCQKLTQREGKVYHDLMASFVHWDAALCSDSIYRMSEEQNFCDEAKFTAETKDMFSKYRPVSGDEDGVVSNILESIFAVVRSNYVALEPAYVNLLCSVLVLESFIMALNPEYNMVRNCAPWLISEGHISVSTVKKYVLAKKDEADKMIRRTFEAPQKIDASKEKVLASA